MHILHYTLGLPPFRTGGMTKFCVDLMQAQILAGDSVSLIWPGRMKGKDTKISKAKNRNGIACFEIINPNPIPYDEGISDVDLFMHDGDLGAYLHFLKQLKPDVIHIHTFLGLHSSLLQAAEELNIRTVYTTHDFFPICAKLTLFHDLQLCKSVESCAECPNCNRGALSIKKMRLLQSAAYMKFKDSTVVKQLRTLHRQKALSETGSSTALIESKAEDYIRLRRHFEDMLRQVSFIHFNSVLTKTIYLNSFSGLDGIVIPITHAGIKDNRRLRPYGEIVDLLYMGPVSLSKGYYLLRDALDKLNSTSIRFRLHIFVDSLIESDYIINHGRYSYNELDAILNDADAVVVPSLLPETFGYTVLEAMSYAVPVVLSSTIGAKDIVPDGGSVMFESGNVDSLIAAVNSLNKTNLSRMNKIIAEQFEIPFLNMEASQIRKLCYLNGNTR